MLLSFHNKSQNLLLYPSLKYLKICCIILLRNISQNILHYPTKKYISKYPALSFYNIFLNPAFSFYNIYVIILLPIFLKILLYAISQNLLLYLYKISQNILKYPSKNYNSKSPAFYFCNKSQNPPLSFLYLSQFHLYIHL